MADLDQGLDLKDHSWLGCEVVNTFPTYLWLSLLFIMFLFSFLDKDTVESCVAVRQDNGGHWFDENCGNEYLAICEKSHPTLTQSPTQPTTESQTPCADGWSAIKNNCYQVSLFMVIP